MHTKSELEAMTMDELNAMAERFNAEKSDDKTTFIYNIIDAESLYDSMQAAEKPAPKKRGRKSKAEKEAMAAAAASMARNDDNKNESPEAAPTNEKEVQPAPAPKKRGRKSKAEKEAMAAAALAEAEAKSVAEEQATNEAPAEDDDIATQNNRKSTNEVMEEEAPIEFEDSTEETEDNDFPPVEHTADEDDEEEMLTEEQAKFLIDGENFIIVQDIPEEEDRPANWRRTVTHPFRSLPIDSRPRARSLPQRKNPKSP